MCASTVDSIELLKKYFGLNQYEAKAYISLLKKHMTLGELSAAAGIPRPRVYDVAKSLETKGFVRSIDELYYAVSPEVALPARRATFRAEFEEEDSRRIQAQEFLVEALKGYGTPPAREPMVLKGLQQIAALLYQVLPQSSKVYLTLNKALEARGVFRAVVGDAVTPNRLREILALLPHDTKLDEEDFKLIAGLGAQVRLTSGVLLDTMVTDGDDVVIGLPDPGSTESIPVVAVYLKDHSFAHSLRETFKKAWSAAVEPPTPSGARTAG